MLINNTNNPGSIDNAQLIQSQPPKTPSTSSRSDALNGINRSIENLSAKNSIGTTSLNNEILEIFSKCLTQVHTEGLDKLAASLNARAAKVNAQTSGIKGFFRSWFSPGSYKELKAEKELIKEFQADIQQAKGILADIKNNRPEVKEQAATVKERSAEVKVKAPNNPIQSSQTDQLRKSLLEQTNKAEEPVVEKQSAPLTDQTTPLSANIPLPPNSGIKGPPPPQGMGAPPFPGMMKKPELKLPGEPDAPSFKPNEYKKVGNEKITEGQLKEQISEAKSYVANLDGKLKPLREYLKKHNELNTAINGSENTVGAKKSLADAETKLKQQENQLKALEEGLQNNQVIMLKRPHKNGATNIPIYPDEMFEKMNKARTEAKQSPIPDMYKMSEAIKTIKESIPAYQTNVNSEKEKLSGLEKEFGELKGPIDQPHKDLKALADKKEKQLADWNRGIVSREQYLKSGMKDGVDRKVEAEPNKLYAEFPEMESFDALGQNPGIWARGEASKFFAQTTAPMLPSQTAKTESPPENKEINPKPQEPSISQGPPPPPPPGNPPKVGAPPFPGAGAAFNKLPNEMDPPSFKHNEYKKIGAEKITENQLKEQIAQAKNYASDLDGKLKPLREYLNTYEQLSANINGTKDGPKGAKASLAAAQKELAQQKNQLAVLQKAEDEGKIVMLQRPTKDGAMEIPVYPDEMWKKMNEARKAAKLPPIPGMFKMSNVIEAVEEGIPSLEKKVKLEAQDLKSLEKDLAELKSPINKPHKELVALAEKKEKQLEEWNRGVANRQKYLDSGLKDQVLKQAPQVDEKTNLFAEEFPEMQAFLDLGSNAHVWARGSKKDFFENTTA